MEAVMIPGASPDFLLSLDRGLAVLAHVTRHRGLCITDVANDLGITRPTVRRILGVLMQEGYVHAVAYGGRQGSRYYALPRVSDLAAGFRDQEWIDAIAAPLMQRWTRQHKWPLMLSTPLAGGRIMVRAVTDGVSRMSRDVLTPGYTHPAELTSAGLLMRAMLPGDQNHHSEGSDPGLAADSLVRAQGYVHRHDSRWYEGRLAVPVMAQDLLVACITMRYLRHALTPDRVRSVYLRSLQTLVKEIAGQLPAAVPISASSALQR
jgi:IclR family mhp operon transcriptional activator